MQPRILLSCFVLFFAAIAAADFTPANRPIDVMNYLIKMEIDPAADPTEFQADVEIKIKALKELTEVTLDIDELDIKYAQVNHPLLKPADFAVAKDGKTVKITLPGTIKEKENFSLSLSYRGKVNTAHSGLFKVVDPDEPDRGPLLFTHFEPLRARAFFPANDEPYDKATTELRVSVPVRYDVVSNGKKTKDRTFRRKDNQWREVHWRMDKPHATYLVSLAIAPFSKVTAKQGGKEISVWVGKLKTERAKFALEATKKMVAFFEKYLGTKYPWPKYATVGLPTFLWGGMENTSSTHMNQERTVLNDPNSAFEKKRIVGLAAHELAHQWFGDYVTMKWWDDIWLNEAFASYLGTLGTKHFFGGEEAELEVVVDTWEDYFRQEDGPRSHPIVNTLNVPDDAFDSISYTKGENVLRMLNFYIGDKAFQKGFKTYLARYAHSNATFQDFFATMEQASDTQLAQFRDTWLLQRGYPVLTYGGDWNDQTKQYTFRLAQRSNHQNERSIFHFKVPVTLHRKTAPAYDKDLVLSMEGGSYSKILDLPAAPEWVSVNTRGVVLAKLKLEKREERALATQALNDPDPFTRTWAAFELASPLKEETPLSETAQKALVEALTKDPSPYVRISLLTLFQGMKTRWLPDSLGVAIVSHAKDTLASNYEGRAQVRKDPHGWRQWRAELLGTLGRVKREEVLPILAATLGKAGLGLDDLGKASTSVAQLGDSKSAEMLRTALKLHEGRGYRYRYVVQYAFGALATPDAANEIRELSKTCGSDLMGRIGWVIRDNQPLKNSSEWAGFLKEFVLTDKRFGDEVKSRILGTIEDVKNNYVKRTLEAIVKESDSDRLKEVSKKILEKNFTGANT